MTCGRCHQDNPSQARFCMGCGAPLALACQHCGAGLSMDAHYCVGCGRPVGVRPALAPAPESYTPKHLAERILTARASLEGERKQVTVLFADMKGSMERLAGRDPEEARRLLDPVLTLMMDAVHRYEGTVNQVMGDGIMALFGAPVAQEDHAMRGCYAAAQMLDSVEAHAARLGGGIEIRVGLNSGEVIVRSIGSDLRMDYTAVGETTHLAARMEQLASPNAAYLTEETWRLARPHVIARYLGRQAVRGLSHPIAVFVLRDVRTTETSGLRPRRVGRFVGREPELEALEQALEAVVAGEARVVGIAGHPGVGKSRLVHEFAERCRARSLTVWQARAVAHGRAMPMHLVLDFLRDYFNIRARDTAAITQHKVRERVGEFDSAVRSDLRPVLDLLGVSDADPAPPLAPEARAQRLLDGFERLVTAGRPPGAAILLLEDLHWIDAASEPFVGVLVEAARTAGVLLVMTFRPPHVAPWMQRTCYAQLPLGPLPRADSQEVVRHLLGEDPSTAALAREILERAAGNPFFIEELVRSLLESGHLRGRRGAYRAGSSPGSVDLPPTIHALLAARIDRLPEFDKTLLQTAAVIGKEFSAAVLQHAFGAPEAETAAALQRLCSSELAIEQPSGDRQYTFVHPLVQEVAHHSLLRERRQGLHGRVARALRELHADRLDDVAALIGYHFEAAGDAGRAARWNARAAIWIFNTDPAQALNYWQKVIALDEAGGDTPEGRALRMMAYRGLLGLGWRLGMDVATARQYFEASTALAIQAGAIRERAMAAIGYGRMLATTGDADEYVRLVEETLRAVDDTDDASLRVVTRAVLSHAHAAAGDLETALASSTAALAELDRVGPIDPSLLGFSERAWLLGTRALCRVHMGRLDAAAADLDALKMQLKAEPDLALHTLPSIVYVEIAAVRGDEPLAARESATLRDLADRNGSGYTIVYARAAAGIARLVGGDFAGAIETFGEGLALARRTSSGRELEGRMLADLADAHLRRGDVGTAIETARAGAELARARRRRVSECQAQLVLAAAATIRGDAEALVMAGTALHAAADLIEATGAGAYRGPLEGHRARLAAARGDRDAERAHATRANELFAALAAARYAAAVDALYRTLARR